VDTGAYANRQHDLGADLGSDPSQSSFNRAMQLAKGVLLVCDIGVVVTSRIWVDFELYRTVRTNAGIDVIIHANGSPHLIAAEPLPGESPYQKIMREKDFPFEVVCEKLMSVELQKGDSSMVIDKVRILNTMTDKNELDCGGILDRLEKGDTNDPQYVSDLKLFSISSAALNTAMACKAMSIALRTDGQDYENFYGNNLLEIIANKFSASIVFDDLTSLDSVTDDVLLTLVKLAGPSVKRFDINVKGCMYLTDHSIEQIYFPHTIQHLSFNVGYGRNLTNGALIQMITKIPPNLQSLDLDVCGFKTKSGEYFPKRESSLLVGLSKNVSSELTKLSFVSTLDDEDGGLEGLITLIGALPPGLKSLSFTFEQFNGFKGSMIVEIFKSLPSALEEFSLNIYNGEHIEDNHLRLVAGQIPRLDCLKELHLHTRSHGRKGYYETRLFHSVAEVLSFAE